MKITITNNNDEVLDLFELDPDDDETHRKIIEALVDVLGDAGPDTFAPDREPRPYCD